MTLHETVIKEIIYDELLPSIDFEIQIQLTVSMETQKIRREYI
jgi:hypothetical protein